MFAGAGEGEGTFERGGRVRHIIHMGHLLQNT
jgi:hypothetical protein